MLDARKKDSILKIDINNVIVNNDKALLLPNKTLKHSSPQSPFIYRHYGENEKLDCLQLYPTERNKRMGTGKLIVTYGRPNKGASAGRISGWVKVELQLAGKDISTFSAHSCCVVSVSKAKVLGLLFEEILSEFLGPKSTQKKLKKFYDKTS